MSSSSYHSSSRSAESHREPRPRREPEQPSTDADTSAETGQPSAQRPPASAPEATPGPIRQALEEAGAVVLDRPESWRWHALDREEAEETMGGLVGVAAGEQPIAEAVDEDCGGVVALALRLNELLRQELLEDPRGLSDAALLDVVRRMEQCRAELDPQARQDLAYLFTGANALELVVELAHDLRSPLTSIMFLAETLRKGQSGEINDVQRDQLGIMYSAALGMVGLANDLMDLAGSESTADWSDSPEESFSIQEIVETARDTVAPMAEQKGLDISFLTPASDSRVGYPVLLTRVLLNLMTNAIKFTDTGRVEVVVEEKPGDAVLFSVRDTGRGMSPEAVESLETLFGRSQSGTGYHFSGTGLGLTMCRRMIEKMGGELQVESKLGGGTRFYFELELPRA